jgi:hypothetical protein
MTSLEIKKQIIKDIIKPFFKNNGFINKGVKYNKNINHFQIKAYPAAAANLAAARRSDLRTAGTDR